MRETKIINLLGGPGSRKTTWRAALFLLFRRAGLDCEEVNEWIKAPVWEERTFAIQSQVYVFAKQMAAMERVIGKTDIIVTDSPLIFSPFYGRRSGTLYTDLTYRAQVEEFKRIGGVNVLLNRVGTYSPAGRLQTADEAEAVDHDMRDFLLARDIPFHSFDADDDANIIRHCFDAVGRPLVEGQSLHLPSLVIKETISP